jgi:hypothetical protein
MLPAAEDSGMFRQKKKKKKNQVRSAGNPSKFLGCKEGPTSNNNNNNTLTNINFIFVANCPDEAQVNTMSSGW